MEELFKSLALVEQFICLFLANEPLSIRTNLVDNVADLHGEFARIGELLNQTKSNLGEQGDVLEQVVADFDLLTPDSLSLLHDLMLQEADILLVLSQPLRLVCRQQAFLRLNHI